MPHKWCSERSWFKLPNEPSFFFFYCFQTVNIPQYSFCCGCISVIRLSPGYCNGEQKKNFNYLLYILFEVVVANIVACCTRTKQSAKVSTAFGSTSECAGVRGEIANFKVPSPVIVATIIIYLIKLCYCYL